MTGMPSAVGPITRDNAPRPERALPSGSPWTGWIVFAAIMLILVGCFQVMTGLVAIFDDKYFVVGNRDLVVHVNYTVWGTGHLVLAAVNIVAGFGLLAAKTWARVWAIVIAGIGAVTNIAFLGAYPVLVAIMITLDVVVIWALTVHWADITPIE